MRSVLNSIFIIKSIYLFLLFKLHLFKSCQPFSFQLATSFLQQNRNLESECKQVNSTCIESYGVNYFKVCEARKERGNIQIN